MFHIESLSHISLLQQILKIPSKVSVDSLNSYLRITGKCYEYYLIEYRRLRTHDWRVGFLHVVIYPSVAGP